MSIKNNKKMKDIEYIDGISVVTVAGRSTVIDEISGKRYFTDGTGKFENVINLGLRSFLTVLEKRAKGENEEEFVWLEFNIYKINDFTAVPEIIYTWNDHYSKDKIENPIQKISETTIVLTNPELENKYILFDLIGGDELGEGFDSFVKNKSDYLTVYRFLDIEGDLYTLEGAIDFSGNHLGSVTIHTGRDSELFSTFSEAELSFRSKTLSYKKG